MITYMDQVVGDMMAKLKEHGLEKNTLVLFTGDNGTHKSITSKLPGMDIKGGKGSMTGRRESVSKRSSNPSPSTTPREPSTSERKTN